MNPEEAERCDCGYNFGARRFYRSYDHMRLAEFFSNSWRTFGANWRTFLALSAIPTVVSLVSALGTEAVVNPVIVFIVSIVWVMVWILSTMALMMAAHRTSDGEAIGVWESYDLSMRLFWRYIWTSILYILIVLGGVFLFIIPGIIWGTRYVFAPYVVLIEGTCGREALSRSKALTKDRLLSIFGRELVLGLLFFLVITIPLALLILLVGLSFGEPFIGFSEPKPEWAQSIELFGRIISEGLFVIFNVLLFKSLRPLADNEGIDLSEGRQP
jgi:hypothetical protein